MADKPTLSMAILDALASWSNVEVQLAMLFGILSGIQDPNEGQLNSKAHTIFDAIISFDARLSVVDALMAEETLSQLEQETWRRCSARLRKLYKKRHALAHFTIMAKPMNPIQPREQWEHAIMPFFTIGAVMRGTATTLHDDQIRERVAHFDEASHAVGYFTAEAGKRHGRREGNPMQEPPLAARLRALASETMEERQKQQKSSSI